MKVKDSNFVYSVTSSELLDSRHHTVDELLTYLPQVADTIKVVRVDWLIWRWVMDHARPIDTLGQIVECKNEQERAAILLVEGLKYGNVIIRHHQESLTTTTGPRC